MFGKCGKSGVHFFVCLLAVLVGIYLLSLIPVWIWWMLIIGVLVCLGCCLFRC